jgi:ATP-dependent DNA helicase RecG
LHNCIAHQNYLSNSRIVLTEEPDFLTFENAGGFYEGSYEDYILGTKTPEHYRNRFLAQAMVNVKMIDTQGYGIHTMYEKQKERFLPMPDYDDSTPNKVVLRLPGSVINEDYSKILIDNMDMDLTTTVLLDKVQKGKVASLSDNAIQLLRSKKYIEGRMPNIYVSKRVAQAADQKVEYSKHKGLEYKKCKVLLLDALEDHKRLSREEIDKLWWNLLSDVLTDKQKKTKVGNMLTKMKEERLIVNKTVGNISYWSLLEP